MEATIERKCSICQEVKPITDFYPHGKNKLGKPTTSHRCKKCDYKKRITEKKNEWHSKHGLIKRMHLSQVKRSKERGHPKPEYSRKQLMDWIYAQQKFHNLYNDWVDSGYKKDKVPSCDRLNDYKPYSFDNIRIVTWEENKKKYQSDRMQGINNKTNKQVSQYDLQGNFIQTFFSHTQAERVTGVKASQISKCRRGLISRTGGFWWQ